MNENRVFDILVIGAGPSGSSAACAASSSGLSVKLIDKRERIGQPVQCGEVISRKCLDHSGLDEDGDWIVGRIKGYRIISPSGDSLVSDSDGFSIYRELFDKALVDRAISSGVKFSSKTDAISTIRKKDLWEVTTSKGTVRSRAVILAAGPTSRLNSMFGLSGNKDLMKAVGMKIPIRDGSEVMEFYTMSKLKGGYGWWFPRGKEVNAGFCSDCDNMSLLHGLLRSKGVPKEITGSYHGGVMPHGGPIERFTGEQVVAVGDCGGFCHPVSKGGIHCALLSGSMGAEAIVRTLSGEVGALNDLVKQIKDHPAFSHKNIDRRDFLASLSDKDLNALTSIAGGRNLRTINKAVALKKALKYPNLVGIAMKGLKMVLDDKRWIDHTF